MNIDRLEKLKIVFSDCDAINNSQGKVGDFFLAGRKDADDSFSIEILKKVISLIESFGIGKELVVENKKIFTENFLLKLQKEGKWSGKMQVDGFSIRFGRVASMSQYFLIVEQIRPDISLTWEDWVAPFWSVDRFVQAWVSDIEFDFWQNATSILEYELAGKSYDKLPLKSNGLPFPLEEMEIDVSLNSGRWLFKTGFIESIGSMMWFGRLFWKCVGDRRERLRSLNWLEVTDLCDGITAVKLPGVRFYDLSTSHIQDDLRKALYG